MKIKNRHLDILVMGGVIDAKGNVLEAEQKTNTNDMSLNDEPSAT